jgi:hypothetical protein
MPALIRERGADSPVVGMKPLPCPVCGDHLTNLTITAPSKGPRLRFSQEVVIGRPICGGGKGNRHVDKTRPNE